MVIEIGWRLFALCAVGAFWAGLVILAKAGQRK